LYAQRKAPYAPRTNPGRGGYRHAPIRARVGLAMRRGMNFGDLPDAESVLRAHGLSLAPMSVGESGLNVGGTSVLPTAQASDLDNGALKGLVIPAGTPEPESLPAVHEVIVKARAKGVPILAFGDGVEMVLTALNRPASHLAQAPAVLIAGEATEAVADSNALATAASRVG
jgi:hypothetical protein